MVLQERLEVLELGRLKRPDFAESLGSGALEPDWEPEPAPELAVLELVLALELVSAQELVQELVQDRTGSWTRLGLTSWPA